MTGCPSFLGYRCTIERAARENPSSAAVAARSLVAAAPRDELCIYEVSPVDPSH